MEIHLIKTENGKPLYLAFINGASKISSRWLFAVVSAAFFSLFKKRRTTDKIEIIRSMILKATEPQLEIINTIVEGLLRNRVKTTPPPKYKSPMEMAMDGIFDLNEKQLMGIYVIVKDRLQRKFGFAKNFFTA